HYESLLFMFFEWHQLKFPTKKKDHFYKVFIFSYLFIANLIIINVGFSNVLKCHHNLLIGCRIFFFFKGNKIFFILSEYK
ncbi:hypothetical protein RSA30_22045, partial [Pantoea stewartii]